MYSTFWYSNNYGYNPYGPYNFGSQAYPYPIVAPSSASGGNCMNPLLPGNPNQNSVILAEQFYPDGTPYKQTVEELRNYILQLENNRKLENLSNVAYDGNLEQGDILFYNQGTGNWEITDYLSSGQW